MPCSAKSALEELQKYIKWYRVEFDAAMAKKADFPCACTVSRQRGGRA